MMFYTNICFISLLYFVTIFLTTNEANRFYEMKGKLPDPQIINKIFNAFVIPIMKSLPNNKPMFKTQKDTSIDEVIENKIKELRPFLQDDLKTVEDNILMEDSDETTIVEFLPKTEENNVERSRDDTSKNRVKKYKKIREKINKALEKESVSDKTKNLILKTLDKWLKKLVGRQCNWKTNLEDRDDESVKIAERWNQGWHTVRSLVSKLLANNSSNFSNSNDVPEFLDNVQILFRAVTDDMSIISKKYKMQCEFVPKNEPTTASNSLRNNWDKTDVEEDKCQEIFICSNELGNFMHSFYQTLNDTSVSLIKNYAEMYKKDVTPSDDNEIDTIKLLLSKIADEIENEVSKIFIKETKSLKLNAKKNKDANIKALSTYIENIINKVKESTKNILKSNLSSLKEQIQTAITDDLNVNVEVDIGNLEREFVTRICTVFKFCNGKYGGRRFNLDSRKKDNLFVNLKLTLDENLTGDRFKKIFALHNVKNTTDKAIQAVTRTTSIYNESQGN